MCYFLKDRIGQSYAAMFPLPLGHTIFGCKSGFNVSAFTQMVAGQFN